jgi:hypothetical protein
VARLKEHVGCFEIYGLLEASRLHRSIARPRDGSALSFADRLSISRREVMSPIRVLIEAVLPNPDHSNKRAGGFPQTTRRVEATFLHQTRLSETPIPIGWAQSPAHQFLNISQIRGSQNQF